MRIWIVRVLVMNRYRNLNTVMVIGAGQMGSGIAQLFAMRGFEVILQDISDISLKRAQSTIMQSLTKFHEKGQLSAMPCDIMAKIKYTNEISECQKVKIIIESIFEDFEMKFQVIDSLNKYIDNTTYIATNTSSFSISDLAKANAFPENFIGFHFMNPVVMMELVEVISGVSTSAETVRFFQNLSFMLGKTSIRVKNSPGFVLNRILIPMINEAIWVLYEGISSPEEIDIAMTLGANHKMGPLALADLIGLDTVLAILKTLQEGVDIGKYTPCPLLAQYVAANKLGRKTKCGFFEYK